MRLSAFVELFAAALYNETGLRGVAEFKFGEISDRYSLFPEPIWEDRILQDREFRRLVDVRQHIGPVRDQRVYLSTDGFRWAENTLGENVAQFLESHGLKYNEPSRTDGAIVAQSSSWTGLPSDFELSEQKKTILISLLDEADRTLDSLGAGNSEKAMARAYIIAARALSDTPDPPADLIWEILQRANTVAGVASLFVSILALFH